MKNDKDYKYEELKKYSENLSHELLTPLAVIRTKAELLLQSENLNKSDLVHIDSILKTVAKLSQLNKGLILLTKIKNDQFIDREDVIIAEVISDSIELMEDRIRHMNLSIRIVKEANLRIHSNLNLLSILFNNLIKNACVHNVENGYLKICITDDGLTIENSGLVNEKNDESLFKRFHSDDDRLDSLGLGLSIVKSICEKLGFQIKYFSENTTHTISLVLK